MPAPDLSILIPAYNMARWLPYAVESCLWQKNADIEAVIVNDGSTDATQDIAEAFARSDARVRVHRQENRGLSGAREAGQALARGRYLMWLDADDFLDMNAAQKMLAVAKRDGVEMVCGNAVVFSDRNFNTRSYFPHPAASRTSFDNPRYWKSKVTWRWIIGREFINNAGVTHPRLKLGQDVVLMYDLLTKVGPFSQCADHVYFFRQEHKGMDSTLETEIEHELMHYVLVRRLLTERGRLQPMLKYLADNALRDLKLVQQRLRGEDERWRPRFEAVGREIFADIDPDWLTPAVAGPEVDLRELLPVARAFAGDDMAKARDLLTLSANPPARHRDKTKGWHAFRRRVKAMLAPLSLLARARHSALERRARARLKGLWAGRNPA